jgi:hypothetical protein
MYRFTHNNALERFLRPERSAGLARILPGEAGAKYRAKAEIRLEGIVMWPCPIILFPKSINVSSVSV